jgi:hypothetical protein
MINGGAGVSPISANSHLMLHVRNAKALVLTLTLRFRRRARRLQWAGPLISAGKSKRFFVTKIHLSKE